MAKEKATRDCANCIHWHACMSWAEMYLETEANNCSNYEEKNYDYLRDLLLNHLGHRVEIVVYGEANDPENVCLEDMDTYEVILDLEIYTLNSRKDV